MTTLVVGTRGSKLALAQTHLVADALHASHPDIDVHIEVISTKGDRMPDVALSKIGDKGLFVKELEMALLQGQIDLAVHSAKDLPSRLPDGLVLGAFLPRADPRDALVVRQHADAAATDPLLTLTHGARVGTSSLRRVAQLRHARHDVSTSDVRGNVDVRLHKLVDGQFDALVLAMAGLQRLGLVGDNGDTPIAIQHDRQQLFVLPLPPTLMLPAIAQGTLAVECRGDATQTLHLLSAINHTQTQSVTLAERAFLRHIEGGCQVPVAAFAELIHEQIHLTGLVCSVDGKSVVRSEAVGDVAEAEAIGALLADKLLTSGASAILGRAQASDIKPLAGVRVVLTRAEGRGSALETRLKELGAHPISYPVIAYKPPDDVPAFDKAMSRLVSGHFDWLVLTSVTGVETAHEWLMATQAHMQFSPNGHTRLAVIGRATAQACADLFGKPPDAVPIAPTTDQLIAAMGPISGRRILLLNADLAKPALADALQTAGAHIERAIAYKTVPVVESDVDIQGLLAARAIDAVIFTSGSTVRNFVERIGQWGIDALQHAEIVCIGPLTAEATRQFGLQPTAVASRSSDEELVNALLAACRNRKKHSLSEDE